MAGINLLEKNLQKILRSAGFDPELRTHLEGYEIDVYVEYKSEQIVFECKQYQRGNLTVRNLIHQWSGKQEELGVDVVVLVLVGVSVSEDDYELAEKRDVQIWQGDKVDELLDDTVDGTTNLREKILLDLDLSEEVIEGRVEEITESYNVQRETAVKYLRGEISESKLESLSQIGESEVRKVLEDEFSEGLGILSDRDIRRFKNCETYYGKPFREVVKKMGELGIQDKKVARLFVGDTGGTAHGEKYSKRAVKKIELLRKEFGYSFTSIKKFVFRKEPKMRMLRRAVNVRSERTDLRLREIYNYLEEGFTVREIKRGDTEKQDKEEESESEKATEDDRGESVAQKEEAGQPREPKSTHSQNRDTSPSRKGVSGGGSSQVYSEKASEGYSFSQTLLIVTGILLVVVVVLMLLQ